MDMASLDRALDFVRRQTHLRTKSYRMLSDGLQGDFLKAFSLMVRPRAVLEIGTFTGYAALCLAYGLHPEGVIDTVEKDDELLDIPLAAFRMAGEGRIRLHAGDAMEIVPHLDRIYDIVYIDADKRLYSEYYDMVFPKVRAGGYILADNMFWSGKLSPGSRAADRQTLSIAAFRSMLASDTRVEWTVLPLRDGLAVIRKGD